MSSQRSCSARAPTAPPRSALLAEFSDEQILDLLLLCGWYHAISFAANGARVPLEPPATRFADVVGDVVDDVVGDAVDDPGGDS